MRKTKKNKRKPIEIYFILYLAALVLLISKSNHKQENNSVQQKKFDVPFTIKVEKPILNCKIWIDSLGNQKYYIDSLNYIWNIGDVEDVRYEFVVEDQNLKHSIKLHSEINSKKTFSFIEDNANQMAIFRWNPTIYEQENKTFTVYVVASAKLSNTTTQERVTSKSQFNLIITHDNGLKNNNNIEDSNYLYANQKLANLDTINNSNHFMAQTLPYSSSTGSVSLQPASSKILAIANQEWENKVFYFNIIPKVDFSKNPLVKIVNSPENNGGTVTISSYQDNFVVLKGTTPSFGSSKVFFTVSRKSDLSEATTSFEIAPQSIQQPIYPKIMYPDQTYKFNPNLPQTLNNLAFLKENGTKIRAASYQGENFEFTPKTTDTGKLFYFERYLDSKLVGTAITIKVESYPEPEISRISELSKNILILNTVSYGWFNNKENYIQELLITGNAKYEQSYGKSFDDKKNFLWYEQFKIFPIDENKTFTFKVVAIDSRGVKSKEKKY